MWDYPQIPARAKIAMAPYVILLLVGLFVADGQGLIDLTGQSVKPHHHRAKGTPKTSARPSRVAKADIPRRLLPLYRKAGAGEVWKTRDGKRYAAWSVLAGVGKVESNHCRARGAKPGGSSSAGALGCMQFMPGTWPGYGHGSIYNPANSIPAAGRYLRANGARRNLAWALAAYNAGPGRAGNPPAVTRQYVANVRALARRYQKGA